MKGSASARSESEKEKTKMRERQRRAITGKIFHGLRRHGGYRLSPRADINEVLRHLAAEAGWSVHSDGTTFRSTVANCCPVCGVARTSGTPTSSVVIAGGGGGGGECSTTASPRRFGGVSAPASTCNVAVGGNSSSSDLVINDGGDVVPMAIYGAYGGGFAGGVQQFPSASGFHGGALTAVGFQQQLQEARASNQNTPVGSPLRRGNYGS